MSDEPIQAHTDPIPSDPGIQSRRDEWSEEWFDDSTLPALMDVLDVAETDQELEAALLREPPGQSVLTQCGCREAPDEPGAAHQGTELRPGTVPRLSTVSRLSIVSRLRLAARSRSFAALDAELRSLAKRGARQHVALRDWHRLSELAFGRVLPRLIQTFVSDPSRLQRAILALQHCVNRAVFAVGEEYSSLQEQLLKEQRRETEQAVLRFSRLSDAGVLGILVCDLFGNIREANDAFLAMIGYSREELLSGSVRWGEMTPPEWRHLDDRAVEQLKASGVAPTWEKEYIRKDGSRLPILVGVALLNETECVAFVLDITERKRLEELGRRSGELETQNRRMQEASRLKSEFLANMSHELRTPLNSIIGFSELLYDGEVSADAPEHREFLGDILRSARHLLQLINDILDLAKVESGKMTFRTEPVSPRRLIEEAVSVLRGLAAAKHIQLETEIDPGLTEIRNDPARLKQILYNYLSNAVKFTPEGGRVVVRARPEGADMFRLEVSDTGIGIGTHDIPRLFLEFQQLESGATKKHAGTGLGLVLTKRIVEAQGGSVGVQSVAGQGSTFFAVLPRVVSSGVHVITPTAQPHRREGAATVLVVEDDARDRTLLGHILSKDEYDVQLAATGSEAIAACGVRQFSAITLDLLLPDMTGLDVLQTLRREGMNRETPVIIVSVISEEGVVGGFSVHDYLHKPINGPELLSSLHRACAGPSDRKPVLVVDDDAASQKLMSQLLSHLGYRVRCADNGELALSIARTEPPLAVVLDLVMPGIDGFEFLARFRDARESSTTPVIVWTMKDLSADDYAELRGRAQAVVAKSATKSLVEELRTLLAPSSSTTDEGKTRHGQ